MRPRNKHRYITNEKSENSEKSERLEKNEKKNFRMENQNGKSEWPATDSVTPPSRFWNTCTQPKLPVWSSLHYWKTGTKTCGQYTCKTRFQSGVHTLSQTQANEFPTVRCLLPCCPVFTS